MGEVLSRLLPGGLLSLQSTMLLPASDLRKGTGIPSFAQIRKRLKRASDVPADSRVLYISHLGQPDLFLSRVVLEFLEENPGFSFVWLAACCTASRTAVQVRMHPGALSSSDAILVVPPLATSSRKSFSRAFHFRGGGAGACSSFTDLQSYSFDPWATLELSLSLLNGTDAYIYFFAEPVPSVSYFMKIEGGEDIAVWSKSVEEAVAHALSRSGLDGAGGTSLEKSWQGMLLPCFLLRAALQDVEHYCPPAGALGCAIRTLSISQVQAEDFLVTWKALMHFRKSEAAERLAVTRLLCFCVAFMGGYVTPVRSQSYISGVLAESLVENDAHLDLWMKGLSPLDLDLILKAVGPCLTLRKVTIGSSATGGAGLGEFLLQHPGIEEVDLEWEAARDMQFLGRALSSHSSLTRLNLTHNDIGAFGARHLGRGLAENMTLTELDVRENGLGSEGMRLLLGGIGVKSALAILKAQDNDIGDDGAIAVTECLFRCKALRCVILDGNSISDIGGKVLGVALRECDDLISLGLSRNCMSNRCKAMLLSTWESRSTEDK
jgi:hypothetical protein